MENIYSFARNVLNTATLVGVIASAMPGCGFYRDCSGDKHPENQVDRPERDIRKPKPVNWYLKDHDNPHNKQHPEHIHRCPYNCDGLQDKLENIIGGKENEHI